MNPPEFYQDNNVITLSERIHRDQTLDNVVLSYDALSSDPEIAALFDLPSDTPLIHYRRMRIINQQPTIIEETSMPRALFRRSLRKTVASRCCTILSKPAATPSVTM